MTRATILVVGEAIGDFIPGDPLGRHYRAVLGGSGFNAALALARFGAPVGYAGALSEDALGRRFRAALDEEGIDAGLVMRSGRPSAVAIVAPLRADGVPEFALYLDATAHAEPLGTPALCPPGVVHLHAASFGATVGPSGEAALALMDSARANGASTSYDVNIRPSVFSGREAAQAAVARRVAVANIVKASLDDLAWLYPEEPVERIVASWRTLGARLVLVTRGADGADCHGPHGCFSMGVEPVLVADTVGAGDTFLGGFLAVLWAKNRLGAHLARANADDLAAALSFACAVAADSCTRPGCDPPRRRAARA